MSKLSMLEIEGTTEQLALSLEHAMPSVRPLLKQFLNAFEKKFPKRGSKKRIFDRGAAEATVWALLGGPLSLYAIGMNGPAIVDLHGILERFALRDLCSDLASSTPERAELYRLMEGLGLKEIAMAFRNLKVWDDKDVNFTEKLTRLRNGAAHKNPRLISNILYSGKRIHIVDIDSVMGRADVIPLILSTLRLMLRLFGRRKRVSKG